MVDHFICLYYYVYDDTILTLILWLFCDCQRGPCLVLYIGLWSSILRRIYTLTTPKINK